MTKDEITSTDRELLELAAKAAGIRALVAPTNAAKHSSIYCWINKTRKSWNPLTDDGDALRLAVRLRINLEFGPSHVYAINTKAQAFYADEESEGLLENATRNVIVRAAASMGAAP